MRHLILPILLFVLVSCGLQSKNINNNLLDVVPLRHAKGFTIAQGDGYKVVNVVNPWDTTHLLQSYILIDKLAPMPDSLPQGTIVRVPIERVVTYTSVSASIMDYLGVSENIIGVCESKYIPVKWVKEGVLDGRVVDLGQATMPSIERLVSLKSDGIITDPYQNTGYGAVEQLGVPIIECAAYMETSPLGHSEWIKFIAAFVGEEKLADSLFAAIETRYLEAKEIASTVTSKKSVIPGKRYGQAWHVAAGDSYMAKIYRDASVSYHWSESAGQGALNLSFESVFAAAKDADAWFITYYNDTEDLTYESLMSEYVSYGSFTAFKERRVYGCNTSSKPIFTTTMFTPDLILKDYVKILYPELLPDYTTTYFSALN